MEKHRPVQSADMDIGGVVVRQYDTGKDETRRPLVLFHGIGHGNNWPDGFIRALNRPVFAFDMRRSAGLTSYPWPFYATLSSRLHPMAPIMKDYEDKAMSALGDLGYDESNPVDVAGFSWGGILATGLAIEAQRRSEADAWRRRMVGRLVVIASAPGRLMAPMDEAAARVFIQPNRMLDDVTAGNFYGGDIKRDPSLMDKLQMRHKGDALSYINQLGAAAVSGFEPKDLRTLRVPTYVMAADDDPIIKPENAEEFMNNLPAGSAELHIERGGGHAFVVTRADKIGRLVDDNLDHKDDYSLTA